MAQLRINFSKQAQKRRFRHDLIIVALGILAIVLVFGELSRLQQEQAARLNASHNQSIQKVHVRPPSISPEDRAVAVHVASSLNVPWDQMLSSLEAVIDKCPDIYLKSIQPDIHKREVVISGEVNNVKAFLAFVKALDQSPRFKNVLPMSQQTSSGNGDRMIFTMKLGWVL